MCYYLNVHFQGQRIKVLTAMTTIKASVKSSSTNVLEDLTDIYRRFGVTLCLYLLELLDPGERGIELLRMSVTIYQSTRRNIQQD